MKWISLLLVSLASLSASGADSGFGCGIGSMVAGEKTMSSSTTKFSTDAVPIVSMLNMTGTSSGKFGCAKHSIVKNEKRSIHFLNANIDQLIEEAAKGRGEYLNGLARNLGCDDASFGIFAQEVQDRYSQLFDPTLKEQKPTLNKLKNMIQQHRVLAKSCGPSRAV